MNSAQYMLKQASMAGAIARTGTGAVIGAGLASLATDRDYKKDPQNMARGAVVGGLAGLGMHAMREGSLAARGVKKAAEVGPYDSAIASRVKALDSMIAADANNRKNHLGHYLLNPFVPGPISEGIERLQRRYDASVSTSTPMAYLVPITGLPGAAVAAIAGDEESRNKARQVVEHAHLPKQASVLGRALGAA